MRNRHLFVGATWRREWQSSSTTRSHVTCRSACDLSLGLSRTFDSFSDNDQLTNISSDADSISHH